MATDEQAELLDRIQAGMTVMDSSGSRVGTVAFVRSGEVRPTPIRVGEARTDAHLMTQVDDEPKVVAELARYLYRHGYAKVDGLGLLSSNRYFTTEQVDSVRDDTVHLAVAFEALPAES